MNVAFNFLVLLSMVFVGFISSASYGEEDSSVNHEHHSAINNENNKSVELQAEIQKKFELSDEQMKSLKDAKLNTSEMAKVAQLSKLSNKPISEVLAMRTDKKMGWGKIAKELGVHPRELGRAVSSLHHNHHEHMSERAEQRMNARMEKHGNSAGKGH